MKINNCTSKVCFCLRADGGRIGAKLPTVPKVPSWQNISNPSIKIIKLTLLLKRLEWKQLITWSSAVRSEYRTPNTHEELFGDSVKTQSESLCNQRWALRPSFTDTSSVQNLPQLPASLPQKWSRCFQNVYASLENLLYLANSLQLN